MERRERSFSDVMLVQRTARSFMRIIAGRYRRRKLLANPGLTTRPITDFVKETIFARLAESVEGLRVADIFAGTGTIGLEALSRGAVSVVFFEKDPKAFELLKRNVAAIKADADCFCWKTDIFRCSFKPKGEQARFLPLELIFFDPPFAMIEDLAPGSELFRVLRQLAKDDISVPGARLVLRTPVGVEFIMPEPWQLERHWPFTHMQVFVYRKPGGELSEAGELPEHDPALLAIEPKEDAELGAITDLLDDSFGMTTPIELPQSKAIEDQT